jgi:hypothetical protein
MVVHTTNGRRRNRHRLARRVLREVGGASVYGTLRRLYAAGALTSYMGPVRGGPGPALQDGRPLNVDGVGDPDRRRVRIRSGEPVLNAFPIPYFERNARRVADPAAGAPRSPGPLATLAPWSTSFLLAAVPDRRNVNCGWVGERPGRRQLSYPRPSCPGVV